MNNLKRSSGNPVTLAVEIGEPYKTIISTVTEGWKEMITKELSEDEKSLMRDHPLFMKVIGHLRSSMNHR